MYVRNQFLLLYKSLYIVFFFFKQKTAYEVRISDWSSDVCASDLWFTKANATRVKGMLPTWPARAHNEGDDTFVVPEGCIVIEVSPGTLVPVNRAAARPPSRLA